jgi:hypothetical protein
VFLEIADHPLHGQGGREKRHQGTQQHRAKVDGGRGRCLVGEDVHPKPFVQARPSESRQAEQEAELRGVLGSQADQHSRDDRHHRPARAGPHCEALKDPDDERTAPRKILEIDIRSRGMPIALSGDGMSVMLTLSREHATRRIVKVRALPFAKKDEHNAAREEGHRDRACEEEFLLDPVVQNDSEDRRGKKRDREVAQEPQADGAAAGEAREHLRDAWPEEPGHRQDRPALNHDVVSGERLALGLRFVKAERARGDDEVPG